MYAELKTPACVSLTLYAVGDGAKQPEGLCTNCVNAGIECTHHELINVSRILFATLCHVSNLPIVEYGLS